ncbi:MAG: hypothetical protein Q4B09_11630, partial [Lachnospiraceae bacterium]|nr:hypothetical protein [Lachnospiraceae bacterium]
MDRFSKKIEELIKALARTRRRKNFFISVAAVVVFVTTYALILPAITIDQESAAEEPGIVLEETVVHEEAPVQAEPDVEEDNGNVQEEITPAEEEYPTDDPADTQDADDHAQDADDHTGDSQDADKQDADEHADDEQKPDENTDSTKPADTDSANTSDASSVSESAVSSTESLSTDVLTRTMSASDGSFAAELIFDQEVTLPEGAKLVVSETNSSENPDRWEAYEKLALADALANDKEEVSAAKFFAVSLQNADGSRLALPAAATLKVTFSGEQLRNDETVYAYGWSSDRTDRIADASMLTENNSCVGYTFRVNSLDYETFAAFLGASRRAADGTYMIVRQGGDGRYYAMASDGSAVPVQYDEASNTASETEKSGKLLNWTKNGGTLVSQAGTYAAAVSEKVGDAAVSETPVNLIIKRTDENSRTAVYTTRTTGTNTGRSVMFDALVLSEDASTFTTIEIGTKPIQATILAAPASEEQANAADESEPAEIENAESESEAAEEIESDAEAAEESGFDFTASADGVKVLVTAPEGAFPEGTTMVVKAIENTEIVSAALEAVEGTNARAKAVDITFYDANGSEIEPALPIRVTMQADVIAENAEVAVVHVDDALQAEVVEQTAEGDLEAAPAADEVVFEADAFSAYVLVYTVDFYFGEYEYSLPGGQSILLSELINEIQLVKNNEGDLLTIEEIADVTFSNPELLAVEKTEDNWLLTSREAFNTEESLTVTLKDGAAVTITVKDAQQTTDLNQLLEDVSIETNAGETIISEDGKIVAKKDESYHFKFKFKENSTTQFDNGSSMYYTLPDGVSLAAGQSGTFSIVIGNRVVTGNTYTVTNDGKVKIDFNTGHRNFRFLENSADVELKVEFSGTISENTKELKFRYDDKLDYEVDVQDKHD